jgi:hypothetical protein
MKRLFWMGIVVGCLSSFLVNAIFWRSAPAYAQGPDPTPAGQALSASPASPQGGGGPGKVGTYFTYQGSLKKNGVPVNASCDFQFKLYDSTLDTGVQQGSTWPAPNTQVTNGIFTIIMDFGDQYQGNYRYLETLVSCPSSASPSYTTLPRQLLTAAPYAIGLRPGATINSDLSSPMFNVMNGDGIGIYSSSINNSGVYGRSIKSDGVTGSTNSPTSAGIHAVGLDIYGIALTIESGAIQVKGAGEGSNTPVFTHVVRTGAGGNICNGQSYGSVIDNTIVNGNPSAILIITPNYGASNAGQAPTVGIPAVYYDATNQCGKGIGKWVIYNLNSVAQYNGSRFNVMAVIP